MRGEVMMSGTTLLSRAQGCLLGQLCGDALGSIVEFALPHHIHDMHPGGLRKITGSPVWNTIAGQPTDDSEMALALARTLLVRDAFDADAVRRAYLAWVDSGPFDVGGTVEAGLRGMHDETSQANGALMRVSPLGIFGARHGADDVDRWARADAAITHVHPVCQETSALFAVAVAEAIRTGMTPREVYDGMLARAQWTRVDEQVVRAIRDADTERPANPVKHQGWVLIAFQNALWQLLHAESLEEALVDTVMRGGDTDTNAAICGALLGAVYGREGIPRGWEHAVLNCRPQEGAAGVKQPRPREYWPVDALELAARLVGA
jgi:ADP-ribosylglycohydrolase